MNRRIFSLALGVSILVLLIPVAFWLQTNPLSRRSIRSGEFTASPTELAELIRVPHKNVRFSWLKEPVPKKGIVVRDASDIQKVILQSITERHNSKILFSLYLDPQYQEQIIQDHRRANLFINTHLIYSYLLTSSNAENLSHSFASFCPADCNLENYFVIQ